MKHITISLEDKEFDKLERQAAGRGTTVEAIVRENLSGVVLGNNLHDPSARAKVRERLAKLAESSPGRLGDWKWNRDDLYAERFSRYQYPGRRSHGHGRSSGQDGESD